VGVLAAPPSLLRAWRSLAESAVEPNPFAAPAFVLPAARHLADGQAVDLIVAEEKEKLVFVWPVRAVRGFRRIPVPAVVGWRHEHCPIGTPLVAGGSSAIELWGHVLDYLDELGTPWAVVERMRSDGPVAQALTRAVAERGGRTAELDRFQRAVLRRRPQPDYLAGRLSTKHRKNLDRARRQLGAELGGEVRASDICRSADGDGVVKAEIEAFLDMESNGWKGRQGRALSSDPAHANFFRDMCADVHAEGRLQLWRLEVADRVVARQCHLAAGPAVFHFKITYDERLARYSPGVLLQLAWIDEFHRDRRLVWTDSCTGVDAHVYEQLYPDRVTMASALVPVHGWRGRIAAGAAPGMVEAYRWLRRRPPANLVPPAQT
jgi:CelD/BcsL family acetyltransferase involved in cellulose biosynthesis